MKRFLHILAALITGLFLTLQLSAQCTPDPACLDTLQPGEYCPQEFPPILLNVPYDEVITFILALEFEHNGTVYSLDSRWNDSNHFSQEFASGNVLQFQCHRVCS